MNKRAFFFSERTVYNFSVYNNNNNNNMQSKMSKAYNCVFVREMEETEDGVKLRTRRISRKYVRMKNNMWYFDGS
jgi:hypothetical protein